MITGLPDRPLTPAELERLRGHERVVYIALADPAAGVVDHMVVVTEDRVGAYVFDDGWALVHDFDPDDHDTLAPYYELHRARRRALRERDGAPGARSVS